MDTFMDKLAQKFTAQEMIKANAAAEAAELQRTREQVKKYNDCLQEMKQVNDDTKEAIAKVLEVQVGTEAVQDKLDSVQEELKNHTDSVSSSITDFVHKENVKVYRNVQAVVVEELKKQNEELSAKLETMAKTQRTTRNLAVSAMLFSLLSAASLAAVLLLAFGII